MIKSSLLLIIAILFGLASCKKPKVEISQVLPLIGLYEGQITYCNNELELTPLLDDMGMPVMNMMKPVMVPIGSYKRRVKVYSLDNFLKNGGDLKAITDSLGLGVIRGEKSKTLIIETQWYCLEDGSLDMMVAMDCDPKKDTVFARKSFPVAVEVKPLKDQTNPFEMKMENAPNDNFPCKSFTKLEGYHINASLQLDYVIGGIHYTMVCQKN